MTANFSQFANATIEDLVRDPHKFGLPTLKEFSHNPESWRGKSDQWFTAIDKGSQILGRRVKKQYYRLKGCRMKTLEEVERTAHNMGLDPWKLVPRPQLRDLGGGWCEIEVILVDPAEEQQQKGILLGQASAE